MPIDAFGEIRTALLGLLPGGVAASCGKIADSYPPLDPAELTATGGMRTDRLQEFAAGRAHARLVLQELGLQAPAVRVGADRAPVWPQGFVGSISHGGGLVLAVAAPCTVLRAIGIDVEPGLPLEPELLNRICRPEEITRLRAAAAPLHQAKMIFSAKESVYKCVAPLMGIFLEFDDLEILLGDEDRHFHVRGHGPVKDSIQLDSVAGRCAKAGGYWITVAWQTAASRISQAVPRQD